MHDLLRRLLGPVSPALSGNPVFRFNVCTDTQESTFLDPSADFLRELAVLPDGDLLLAVETHADLLDTSGKVTYIARFGTIGGSCVSDVAPDPDGASFWMGWDCTNPPDALGRFDLASGTQLTEWAPSNGEGDLLVYNPPPTLTTPTPPTAPGGTGGPPPSIGGSGTPPTSGAPGPAPPAGTHVKALLSPILVPRRNLATIKALLTHGGYSFNWKAPSTGYLLIAWYQASKGAHVSRKRTPLLIATVVRTLSQSKTVRITVALTPKGRQLLRSSRRLEVSAIGSFAPRGKPATTVRKSFTLTG